MRKYLTFALLVPAMILTAFFVGAQFGYAVPYGTPTGLLIGAAAWVLLFLIVHGSLRGWRSVRLFLVIFVAGKFGAILYHQLVVGMQVDQLLLRLGGAAILSCFFFAMFWPRRRVGRDGRGENDLK